MFSGLCSLFSFPVRSLGHSHLGFLLFCFFLFCAFGSLLCDCPESSLVSLGPFQSSSCSAPLLRTLLRLPVLSLLLSSPGHLYSSWFPIGCSEVRFCSWGCYCSCCYGCCSTFVSSFCIRSAFFRMLRFCLLLTIFLCIFPHATAAVAPSSLPPRFPHAAVPAAPFAFGEAPAVLFDVGSPDAVPWGLIAVLPCVYARFLSYGLLQVAFVYRRFVSSGCGLSLCVSSSSYFV